MSTTQNPPSQGIPCTKGKKFLDQYREALRNRHYSLRTDKTYIQRAGNFILLHNKHKPA